jgi:glutamate--cysteine ligase
LHALRERGVEYVEVRLMDLNPFEPVGITAATIRLLDVFLLHCLLSESPEDTPTEIAANARNQHRVAARGREPGLRLERNGGEYGLREWGGEILAACDQIAAALDAAHGGAAYRDALTAGIATLDTPDTLPSARVLKTMAAEHANTYVRFVLQQSRKHRASIEALALPADIETRFAHMAADSLQEQRNIESADSLPFEVYRQKYLSPDRLGL